MSEELFFLFFYFFLGNSSFLPKYYTFPVQEDYIPIIGYHQIGDISYDTVISIEDFEYQVYYMTNVMSCNWITMDTLAFFIVNQQKIPTRACVMTFDDGHITQYYNGLSILDKYKVKATFYIVTDYIDIKKNYMTWNQVDEIYKKGHDIASHTRTHPKLENLKYETQETEILESKKILQEKGYNSNSIAYPYGSFNEDTLKILEESNYLVGRAIETWKRRDKRPSTINNKWELYYFNPINFIKYPERIFYTGWWQFEENYKIIGNSEGISINEEYWYRPTSTSYSLLNLTKENNQVQTNFLIKYEASFSIEIIISKENNNFSVYIDNIFYSSYEGRNTYKNTPGLIFKNYYIDIDKLDSGLHTISVKNNDNVEMLLDKYRIYSNKNQDFFINEVNNEELQIEQLTQNTNEQITQNKKLNNINYFNIFTLTLLILLILLIVSLLITQIKIFKTVNKYKNNSFNIV